LRNSVLVSDKLEKGDPKTASKDELTFSVLFRFWRAEVNALDWDQLSIRV